MKINECEEGIHVWVWWLRQNSPIFNNMADSLTFILLAADDLRLGVQYYIKVTLQLLCFGLLHISEGFGDLPCVMSQRVLRPLVQAGVLLCLHNVCNKTNGPLQQKAVKRGLKVRFSVFSSFSWNRYNRGTFKNIKCCASVLAPGAVHSQFVMLLWTVSNPLTGQRSLSCKT